MMEKTSVIRSVRGVSGLSVNLPLKNLFLLIIMSPPSKSKEIKIDLNFKVSPEFSCVLAKGIVDSLLFYRHQIPFNFSLFEKLINKKEQEEETNCFKRLKLINLARSTYESVCGIKTVRKRPLIQSISNYLFKAYRK